MKGWPFGVITDHSLLPHGGHALGMQVSASAGLRLSQPPQGFGPVAGLPKGLATSRPKTPTSGSRRGSTLCTTTEHHYPHVGFKERKTTQMSSDNGSFRNYLWIPIYTQEIVPGWVTGTCLLHWYLLCECTIFSEHSPTCTRSKGDRYSRHQVLESKVWGYIRGRAGSPLQADEPSSKTSI